MKKLTQSSSLDPQCRYIRIDCFHDYLCANPEVKSPVCVQGYSQCPCLSKLKTTIQQ